MDLQVSIRRGIEHATRLRFLSGVAWSSPELLFQRVGLVTGMNCLDVRCGVGKVTLALARLAGARGKVVGIDPEEHLLLAAREEAGRQGLNVEFRLGDVAEITDFAHYDLVYTRFLLSKRSNDEAEAVLHRMISAVRPGGMIVVEDLECRSDRDGESSENPAYSRFLELFNALVHDDEVEARRGPELALFLEHAGVSGVHCHELPTTVTESEPIRNPASMVLSSMRQAIVAAQLATRTEVDRLVYELARYRINPDNLFWLPRIVQAWGIVPSPMSGL
jgi:SAM-dependent methyltransferase